MLKLLKESNEELLRILSARYHPNATFVDPLVAAHPRTSMELQFYALHRIFTHVEVEAQEPEVVGLQGKQAGLWQVRVDNTQCYTFSRTNKVSQHVLSEGMELEVTTLLTLDPRLGQVVRHEDVWRNVGFPRLPMLWRRFNAGCTNTVFRMLGWGREVQQGRDEIAGLGGVDTTVE